MSAYLHIALVLTGSLLFGDDFEDGNADGWQELSMVEYTVEEGMYHFHGGYEENHGIAARADGDSMSTPDYAAVCLVRPEVCYFAGSMVRFDPEAPYNLMLVLSSLHQALVIIRWDWSSIELLDQASFGVSYGSDYMVRFECRGDVFRGRAWPAGETEPSGWMVQTTDPAGRPGSMALFAAGVSGAHDVSLSCRFDDVSVTTLQSGLTPGSWGGIKALWSRP